MCGIIGYIGEDEAAPIILNSLKKLEYRGYDSAGIAVCEKDNNIQIEKSVGKLENLINKTDNGKILKGTKGIGHTRWATHGKPTTINAHPHIGDRFVIVHNGIIENEQKLKKMYFKDVEFYSDTDTEVIVKLLEKFTQNGESITFAIEHIISVLEGSYALLIIDKSDTEKIYAVKNKSPLIVGKGENFNIIGSDAIAMISKTQEFFEIHDKEFLILTDNTIEIYSEHGKKIDRLPYHAELDLSDIEKGTYTHYMLKEIEEQPAVIRKILKEYSNNEGNLYIDKNIIDKIKMSDSLYIIACGTSYHASLVGKYYFEKIAKIPTTACIASEFVNNIPILSKKPFFIIISQSGETADCRAALLKIKELGHKVLIITNVKGSTLSRESDFTLLLHAGPEIAVASTKAYCAQLALLLILSSQIRNDENININYELSKVSNVIERICEEKEHFTIIAKEYLQHKKNCFYIGRGIDYYVSLEASLKLKEISYIHTEGLPSGELKHGTIALIEDNTPVIAIISQKEINQNTRSNIKEVKSRGADVITISIKSESYQNDTIIIDNVHEMLTPLVIIVPCQYLAYFAALQIGCDIDKPRNLAKSVTVE